MIWNDRRIWNDTFERHATLERLFGATLDRLWIDCEFGAKRANLGRTWSDKGGSKKGLGFQNFQLGGPGPGPGPGPEFRLLAGPSRYVRSRSSYKKHRSKGKIASNRSLKPFLEEDT
jgi:hypothetical protein